MSTEQLREALAADPAARAAGDLSYEVRPAPLATRNIDPTVLVAITNAASAVLGVVITGLFQLAQSRRAAAQQKAPAAPPTIVVVNLDGSRLELPVGTPQAEVDKAVEQAAKLGVAHIYVSGR
jgi:hypothetical protein